MSDRINYKEELSYSFVASKLRYEPETGKFFWLENVSRNIKAGYEAGCEKATRIAKGTGQPVSYRYIRVGREIPAVQLAWLLGHGEWATGKIYFKDKNPLNLRLDNLEMSNSLPSKFDFSSADGNKNYLEESRKAFPLLWKERDLQKKFGLSLAEYGEMLVAQNGKCAICQQPETEMRDGKRKSLAVDHDHTTGKVRELLCTACNQMIGKAKEDRNILLSAIQYLDKHSEASPNVVSLESKG